MNIDEVLSRITTPLEVKLIESFRKLPEQVQLKFFELIREIDFEMEDKETNVPN